MLEKKYNPIEVEKEIQKYWENNNIYKFEKDERPVYSVDTPPPTVNGSLHVGHVFSYTQAEILVRYKRQRSYNIFYPIGFDDNGLPSERLVEKEHEIKAKDIPRSEFNKLCLETTKKYENEFKALFKSLGFNADWNLQYETISDLSIKISQKSFLDLYKKGKVYQKDSPVLWCTNCATSIAQAELDSVEKDTFFNDIIFKVDDKDVIIATTRPEYLNSCVAVIVNPDDDRYKDLIGKKAIVPLYNFEVPIYSDELVDTEKGTGIVMCCTYGDMTDKDWQDKFNLPYKALMTNDGVILDDIKYIGGLKILDARKKIIELLKEHNLLLASNPLKHIVGVHERCGIAVEIIPSPQWYIDVLNIKNELIEQGNKINWYPKFMQNRYNDWVTNLKWDWCISRQRYFGVPFPIWYCKACGEVIVAQDDELPVNPLETMPKESCKCGSHDFIPETAVMDTWATSSVTPQINARQGEIDEREYLQPMSLRPQAHEIIRTWAFYTIVKSYYNNNDIPWKDIAISGFVLAKKGEKISKSKNNAILSPNEMIEKHSADAIRYWAASNKLGTDTWFIEDDLLISKRFITKLWNASKFTLMQLDGFSHEIPKEILPQDKWIIEKSKQVTNNYIKHMEEYESGLARGEVDTFFWNDFCDDYLELVKERTYKPEIHGEEEKKSAQYALYTVLLQILKLYSTITPHITEKIYLEYFKEFEKFDSVSIIPIEEEKEDQSYIQYGGFVHNIITTVRKYKTEKNLSMKDEIDTLNIIYWKEAAGYSKENFDKLYKDLKACTSAKNINYIPCDNSSEQNIEII